MTDNHVDNILIVEDEEDIAVILKLHLEDAGYETSWAANGEVALKELQSGRYSLTLLDMRMPGINGLEVLNRIHQSGIDTAVVMMTAYGSENLVAECMKAGAVDYFTKPFDMKELLRRIELAISKRLSQLEKLRFEKEKNDFFFMLSHDLKNPLTATIGSIDIIREGRLGPINAEQTEYLQSAMESCEEIIAMIDNLLDLQRFSTAQIRARMALYDPCQLLEKAVKRFAPAVERERINLTFETHGIMPEISVDNAMMSRVIMNILANAIKFTPENGTVTVTCKSLQGISSEQNLIPEHVIITDELRNSRALVRISIKDNGSGIPAEDLHSIFNSYVQSSGAVARIRGGAGLGLAFCKLAIESFKGCIWANSGQEDGSEFIILLPGHTAETS